MMLLQEIDLLNTENCNAPQNTALSHWDHQKVQSQKDDDCNLFPIHFISLRFGKHLCKHFHCIIPVISTMQPQGILYSDVHVCFNSAT